MLYTLNFCDVICQLRISKAWRRKQNQIESILPTDFEEHVTSLISCIWPWSKIFYFNSVYIRKLYLISPPVITLFPLRNWNMKKMLTMPSFPYNWNCFGFPSLQQFLFYNQPPMNYISYLSLSLLHASSIEILLFVCFLTYRLTHKERCILLNLCSE